MKRRTRKKTCEIDSIDKLNLPIIEQKPIEESKNVEFSEKSLHPFGKFNITIEKSTAMTAEELRHYYDNIFGIKDSEKTAKFITQEKEDNEVYEPELENSQIKQKKTEKPVVQRILSKFINDLTTEFPTKTDILCWWCCNQFDSYPLPCPISYNKLVDKYKVNGVFCGWSCVAAYSLNEYKSLCLVYQLREQLTGETSELYIAPSKYILKCFGGFMDIEDYRKMSSSILISTENISYINQEIVEIKN